MHWRAEPVLTGYAPAIGASPKPKLDERKALAATENVPNYEHRSHTYLRIEANCPTRAATEASEPILVVRTMGRCLASSGNMERSSPSRIHLIT